MTHESSIWFSAGRGPRVGFRCPALRRKVAKAGAAVNLNRRASGGLRLTACHSTSTDGAPSLLSRRAADVFDDGCRAGSETRARRVFSGNRIRRVGAASTSPVIVPPLSPYQPGSRLGYWNWKFSVNPRKSRVCAAGTLNVWSAPEPVRPSPIKNCWPTSGENDAMLFALVTFGGGSLRSKLLRGTRRRSATMRARASYSGPAALTIRSPRRS